MHPTLDFRDIAVIASDPRPTVGQIVVFHPPIGALSETCGKQKHPVGEPCPLPTSKDAAGISYIQRIVAGPGDRVSIKDGHVIRNGRLQKEPFATSTGCTSPLSKCNFRRPITVPAGYYFIMGDNRAYVSDSRFWGPVRRSWIEGHAIAVCRPAGAPCRTLP
jgi:signal peptidase I